MILQLYMLKETTADHDRYYRAGRGNGFCWVDAQNATVWTTRDGPSGAKGAITWENNNRVSRGLEPFEVEVVPLEGHLP